MSPALLTPCSLCVGYRSWTSLSARLRQAASAASDFCFGEVHRSAVLIEGGTSGLTTCCRPCVNRPCDGHNRDKLVPQALNMSKRKGAMAFVLADNKRKKPAPRLEHLDWNFSQARAISQARGYALVCARVESQTRGSEHYHTFWCHPNEPPQNSEESSTPDDSRSRRSGE